MVWQETEEVAVIVMLTKMHELGQDKCFQYFPSQVGEEPWEIRDDGEFGDGFKAKITLLESTKDRKSACEVRKFELKVGGKSKIVWHLFFKGWPDYNVPEGTDKVALLELIRLANEKNSGPHNPLIVHCKLHWHGVIDCMMLIGIIGSAGVGRSGTFITLDHFLHEFEAGVIDQGDSEDPVFDVVNNLREQRMYMVQSQVQFQFIYQVLREQFQQRDKSASPRSSGILAEEDDSEDNYTGYY